MFERFSDRARVVVTEAQHQARQMNHDYIGTEHLLLALLHVNQGTGVRVLRELDPGFDAIRDDVEAAAGTGEGAPSGHIKFTKPAKKVLELSLREALQFGHRHIGTEHLLLGMIREGDGIAAQVLGAHGVTLSAAEAQVVVLVPPAKRARTLGDEEEAVVQRGELRVYPPLFQIREQLREITLRLTAIEHRLGIERDEASAATEASTATEEGSAGE
jgi:ATP-dependent Clp protease ATP-binding subunit ClpC